MRIAIIGITGANQAVAPALRLVRATDNNDPAIAADNSLVTHAYDSLSRIIEETERIGALDAKAIDSAWRAENLLSGLTYPNGRQLAYTYDRLDRLDTVSDAGAAPPIADYDYIGTYRVLVRAYPQNGTRMTYLDDAGTVDIGYDGLRRPVELRHLRSDNSLIVGFTHPYDRMNNKLGEAKLYDAANSEIYSYDSAYRLIDFDRPDPGAIDPLHSDWRLDGPGNWQQVISTESGSPATETREHSSFNELVHRQDGAPVDLDYDDNGNQTNDGQFEYRWDALNRLRTVTRISDGALVATYSYDLLDRRIRKEVTNSSSLDGTTDFYLNGWQVLEERDQADALVQQYVFGAYIDEPLVIDHNVDADDSAIHPNDQRLFYHSNTLYSVYALTNSAGVTVEGYLYDGYGRQTVFAPGPNGVVNFGSDDLIVIGGHSFVHNPWLFTGQRHDAESQLDYYKRRFFNTTLGRFLSRDPRMVQGDGQDNGATSFDLNLYEYVKGRATAATDPTGEMIKCVGLSFFAAYWVAASGSVLWCWDDCCPPSEALVICVGIGGGMGASIGLGGAVGTGCLSAGWSGQLTAQGSAGIASGGGSAGTGGASAGGSVGPSTSGFGGAVTIEGCHTWGGPWKFGVTSEAPRVTPEGPRVTRQGPRVTREGPRLR